MYAGLTFLAIFVFTLANSLVLDEDMLLYWRRSGDSSKCEPFTTFFISCNKCVCSADGTASCTKMACFKAPRFVLRDSEELEKITPVQIPDNAEDSESSSEYTTEPQYQHTRAVLF